MHMMGKEVRKLPTKVVEDHKSNKFPNSPKDVEI
jgi:hypothetical protein